MPPLDPPGQPLQSCSQIQLVKYAATNHNATTRMLPLPDCIMAICAPLTRPYRYGKVYKTLSHDMTFLSTSVSCRLAESAIWDTQPQFYRQHGVDSWNRLVPSMITTSVFFTKTYAQMITAYVKDSIEQGYTGTFTIVEPGAAQGKFSFRCLSHLEQLFAKEGLEFSRLRYLMCDCSNSIREFWEIQPQLRPFVTRGILSFHALEVSLKNGVDFADIAVDELQRVILIGNYFFDSLYQNAYAVDNEQVYPVNITLNPNKVESYSPKEKDFSTDHGASTPHPDPNIAATANAHLNLGISRFLLPEGAFALMSFFRKHCEQLLLLSSDKGITSFQHSGYSAEYSFKRDGVLSCTVNYFAMADYVQRTCNGDYLLAPEQATAEPVCFHTNVFICDAKLSNFPRLQVLADQITNSNTPCQQHLLKIMLQKTCFANLQEYECLLDYNCYDPTYTYSFFVAIEKALQDLSHSNDLRNQVTLLERVQSWWFFSPNLQDQRECIALAGLYLALRSYSNAKCMIDKIANFYGYGYDTHRLFGRYYFLQEAFNDAERHFNAALQAQPDCAESKNYLQLCQAA